MEGLVIRPFVRGQDERAWIELVNAYYGRYYGSEHEPVDEDDVEWSMRTPWWRNSQVFLAELSGEPVGIIWPWLDRGREPPKGYIWRFAAKPELEGSEVDRALLEHALAWLASRGARSAQITVRDNMRTRMELLRSKGFKLIRSFSIMRLRPDELPGDLEPSQAVELRQADPLGSEEDLRTLNALYNESFSEHFDFRPETLEETRAWFEHEGYEDYVVFALLDGRPVGFVVATVSKDLPELSFKSGFINAIGVLRAYRRQGVGTALMLEAIEWLTSKGAEVVELGVDDENPTGAPAFYRRLGFRVAFKHLTFLREF